MEAHDCNFHEGIRRCINDRCLLHRSMRTLAACLRTAAGLTYAAEREGSGCYCAFCDAPIPRSSRRYCDHHGCLACEGSAP